MSRTRGMTLLEVLAALALLSSVLAVLVPVFREAARLSNPEETEVSVFDLSTLADVLLQQKDSPLWDLPGGSSSKVFAPREGAVTEITVRRRPVPAGDLFGRGWLVFEHGDIAVMRWLPSDAGGLQKTQ